MQRLTRVSTLLPALLVLLGLTASARAATVSLRVPDTIYAGERFEVRVVVSGARTAPEIDVNPWRPFDLRAGGTSTFEQTINGRWSRRTEHAYTLTAPADDVMRLPSIEVRVDGQTLTTEARFISLEQPRVSENFHVRLSIEDEQPFVGEPVRLQLVFYLSRQAEEVSFSLPGVEEGFDLYDPPLGELRRRAGGSDRLWEAAFLGKTVGAVIGEGSLEGRRYTTVTIEQILVARSAGEVRIGPAVVSGEEVVGRQRVRRRSVFDDGVETITERFIATSEPLTLDVEALPMEGRPAGFGGLVGSYEVEAEAGTAEASVGEPIPLTVRVIGPSPIDLAGAPDLESQASIASSFKTARTADEAEVSARGEGEAKSFMYTLRARSAEVQEIPPIELAYFDPESERYEVARSAAIPLEVRSTRRVTLEDAVTNAPAEREARGEALESAPGGLAPVYAAEEALRPTFSIGDALRSPVWIAAGGGPAAAYGLTLAALGARRRLSSGSGAARRRVFGEAQRDVRAGDAEAIQRAVARCVGACVDRRGEALTAREAEAALRECGAGCAAEIGRLLRRCEGARYGGSSEDASALRAEAIALLERLRREAA